eukprot:11061069-Alexandrium_andersonii.AAC.1
MHDAAILARDAAVSVGPQTTAERIYWTLQALRGIEARIRPKFERAAQAYSLVAQIAPTWP